ncbi:protein angel homolog 2-like isoform X2 [Eriocheir sinensis]|nr:protein angel homolog 2-like isoform X2 [Eriocheir sinensis]
MPGWLARRLVAGACWVGRDAAGHWRLCDGAAGQLRVRGMAAKRGVEGLSPVGPARHRKRACGGAVDAGDFIPFNSGSPAPPSPPDLGEFIFIDTNPTPVPDAPVPPSWRRAEAPEVVVGSPAAPSSPGSSGDADIAVVYEGPGRGGAVRTTSPLVTPRRSCHTRARRGIKTQAPAAPALAPPEDDDEVEVLVQAAATTTTTTTQEVEVIDVDSVEEEEEPVQVEEETVESDDDGGGGGVVETDEYSDDGGDGAARVANGRLEVRRAGFVALGAVAVAGLANTSIDLEDGVLRRRRRLEALRAWDETGLGRHVARHGLRGGAVPLTVLSYNVLAQSLLRGNAGLYRGCDEAHLTWEYRWALLQHEVESLDPDVLLLQEVEAAHYHSHFLPWLAARGYRGLYKKRTGDKADGCAIFYRREAWRLAEHRSVEYLQPHAPAVLDRDNVGLIARLEPRGAGGAGGAGVVVATTHLLYNPRRHDVKLAQAALMMAELDRLCYQRQEAGQPVYLPMVLAGDLNAEPHSAVISFLRDGRLHYEDLAARTLVRHGGGGHSARLGPALLPAALGITAACQHAALAQGRWLESQSGPLFSPADKRRLEEALIHLHHSDRPDAPRPATAAVDPLLCPGWLTHGFMLNSVYRGRRQGREGAPEVTTFQERWCCVDYMLYSRRRGPDGMPVEGRLKLLARMALPSARQARDYGPMPCDVCPSDHFPLAAKFMLTS